MRRLALLVFGSFAALSACSGARLEGSVYRDEGLSFRIGEVPAGWQPVKVSHAKIAFRDDARETTVLVNGRCGQDAEDVPLGALTNHLFMTFTERDVREQKIVPMDGREAQQTLLRAKLDGVPMAFDVFVLKKDGCVYDFIQISSPERFEQVQPAFERFVSGFHTLSSGQ